MRKNNKGFTLVELLVTVLILAILVSIGMILTTNIIKNSKKNAVAITKSNIAKGASYYTEENHVKWYSENNNTEFEYYCTTVNSLINTGYIKETDLDSLKDLDDGKITADTYIKMQRDKSSLVIKNTTFVDDSDSICKIVQKTGRLKTNNYDTSKLFGKDFDRLLVEKLYVVDYIDNSATWDVSQEQNGSIMAWYTDVDYNGMYEFYIGAQDKVIANPNSEFLFADFKNVVEMDLKHFDTSNVTTMKDMFRNCESLVNLNLRNFDTSKVTNMSYMFFGSKNLENIDVSSFNTSNVTTMSMMFDYCKNLKSLNLKKFNTSKVTDMNYMFVNCSSLANLDVSSFDTSKVTGMKRMFNNAGTYTNLDISSFNTSNVTNMEGMFADTSNLEHIKFGSGFDTSKVTDMSYMFGNLSNLEELDVSKFNTSRVADMHLMFSGVSNVDVLDVSKFNTSRVTDMSGMFRGCSKVEELNLNNFNTSKVTNMRDMFYHLRNVTNLDVSSFDTSSVTDMSGMFLACVGLTKIDISNFDTRNVINMGAVNLSIDQTHTGYTYGGMFQSCDNLKEIVFGPNFNTSKVTNMSAMFAWNKSLETLDLTKFNTSNVEDMSGMFYRMYNIKNIYVSDKWNTNKVSKSDFMFSYSTKLPNFNSSVIDKTNAHYNNGGYLNSKS